MMTLREVCSDATQTVILRDCARIGQVYNIGFAGVMSVRNAFTVVTNAISGGEREHLVHHWWVPRGTESAKVTVAVNPLPTRKGEGMLLFDVVVVPTQAAHP